MKKQNTIERKYFQIIYMKKDLYPESIKKYQNSIRKQETQIKKWAKDLETHFTKEGIQIINKQMGLPWRRSG